MPVKKETEPKPEIAKVEKKLKTPVKSVKDEPLAKAGKRSAKAVKEQVEKEEKEARKATAIEQKQEAKPVKTVKPAKSRLERRSKTYREKAKLLEKDKVYSLSEASALVKKTSTTKFDASVEVHINLNIDPKHADQNIRDTLSLPSGTGKKQTVAVLSDNDSEATKAGADIVGKENIFALLDKGKLDFDILIASPSIMPELGKYARVLGPRGLMPSPKSGTVTTDIAKAVAEAKAGRVEYRVDSSGIVHLAIGKVSFSEADLSSNIDAVLTSIKSNKPASVKGAYIKSVYLTSTMGPSIKIDIANL
ncbi:MAG TPA: 50S ribosomal protein L1 [Candidatus Sulfotelmatobacter sp.]|nr:50S ribosomal protein L1 [Candidatus Sulfotelmatobacter sp.]